MKKTIDILKKGIALTFVAALTYGCGQERAPEDLVEEGAGTSSAIVEDNPSAANLNNPRPAPVGDTARTGNQADQFGNLPSNVDSSAREMNRVDQQRQLEENPNQKPTPRTPSNRRVDGTSDIQ
ncbi:hypothetical protein [Pontibacter sp. SGAir0037]|uniref:hypothetical protein n=1 Tax=Pontibacter sp. SGAir0037 TaxID=2571030 RepID=UPI0010CCC6F9|nr:hypothetical protein [Pontibacter sp. SGAir0037]QCR24278.1 hypothetical protein C1N53_19230 [Pontibacter sp. SGAir0037]